MTKKRLKVAPVEYPDTAAVIKRGLSKGVAYAPTELGVGVVLIGLATKQLQCLERIEALLCAHSVERHQPVEPKYDGSRFGRKAK